MKQPLSIRRILVQTIIIVLGSLLACLACNLLAPLFLPFPNG